MVSRVVVELFLTAPVDALAEDLPKIMEIITGLGENDGKLYKIINFLSFHMCSIRCFFTFLRLITRYEDSAFVYCVCFRN